MKRQIGFVTVGAVFLAIGLAVMVGPVKESAVWAREEAESNRAYVAKVRANDSPGWVTRVEVGGNAQVGFFADAIFASSFLLFGLLFLRLGVDDFLEDRRFRQFQRSLHKRV